MAMSTRSKSQTQMQNPMQTKVFSNSRRGSTEMASKQTDITMTILRELREFKTQSRQELKETRDEIRTDMHREIEGLARKLDKISNEINEIREDVVEVTEKTRELEERTEKIYKEREQDRQNILIQEIRYRERSAKIRGLPEKENERILDYLLPELARYMKITEELLDTQIEKIFRINSTYARERNLPRDVAICFTNVRTREKLCQINYDERLMIEGKEIEIFRDIPAYVLKKRQEYRFLTQLLQRREIRYRWEKIEGITFTYKQRRYKVNTVEKAKEMYRRLKSQERKEGVGEVKKDGDRNIEERVIQEKDITNKEVDSDEDESEEELVGMELEGQNVLMEEFGGKKDR